MAGHRGDWVQTWTGTAFYPLDPTLESIKLLDIATALSKICRYNGHCSEFYSVAEHSVLVSENVKPEYAMEALMHDASEAYICDIPRPIKPMLKGYKVIESNIMAWVYLKFKISPTIASRKEVGRVDTAILADEAKVLMNDPQNWHLPEPPLGIEIHCWDHKKAAGRFLARYAELKALRQ